MKHLKHLFTIALALMAVASALACPFCKPRKTGLFIGETEIVGNGSARTWVLIDKDEKPQAVGVTMTETALEGLNPTPPNGMPMEEFNMRLPRQAEIAGFDHVALDWNPIGHEPDRVYTLPHFDFHFYKVPQSERTQMKIIDGDLTRFKKPLPKNQIPEGYIYGPGGEVQYMGAHYVDVRGGEFNGKTFDKCFIFGSYNGEVIFWEPMITLNYLQSKPDSVTDIPQPRAYPKPGYYPTKYTIRYDAARREYNVALEGFVWRD